jgi:hypothetical protein
VNFRWGLLTRDNDALVTIATLTEDFNKIALERSEELALIRLLGKHIRTPRALGEG